MEIDERTCLIEPAGVMTACKHRDQTQHGKPQRDRGKSTGNSRELGRAGWGGGEVRSTEEAG
jgi:hypothetical protein